MTATATDASNNESPASVAKTATDTTAPDAPVIDTDLTGKANTKTPIEVTAEPGTTVVLTAGGKEIGRGTAGADGKVTITPTENIPVGDVTVTATDASGNKSTPSEVKPATDTTAPEKPVIDTDLTGKANTKTPIEVTAEPGTTVVLTAGGKEIGRGTAGADGKVTITPTENIPVGDVTVTATDASGNKSTPSEVKPATDTTAPDAPVIDTGDGQQRPATPSDDTNPRPDTVTPAEVPAVQSAEQPSQTVEVPAQLPNEVSETDSSVSQPQAVLPNTGTQEDRATGAFGVLSLLGAFGLLFAKKKKDDEEEA